MKKFLARCPGKMQRKHGVGLYNDTTDANGKGVEKAFRRLLEEMGYADVADRLSLPIRTAALKPAVLTVRHMSTSPRTAMSSSLTALSS